MNLNTTESMKKASIALKEQIEDTVKNTAKKMARLGKKDFKTVKARIVKTGSGSGDDVVFVGLNGENFYYKRGESYDIPEDVAAILERSGEI